MAESRRPSFSLAVKVPGEKHQSLLECFDASLWEDQGGLPGLYRVRRCVGDSTQWVGEDSHTFFTIEAVYRIQGQILTKKVAGFAPISVQQPKIKAGDSISVTWWPHLETDKPMEYRTRAKVDPIQRFDGRWWIYVTIPLVGSHFVPADDVRRIS